MLRHPPLASAGHLPPNRGSCLPGRLPPPNAITLKDKGSPYSIVERRVPELIPVFGSHPAGDVSNKLGGRLPLLPPGLQIPSQP